MVILEALSVGCPVVASDSIPDLPDCVHRVNLQDDKGWTDAISNPITTGLQNSVERHHIELVSKQWGGIYDRIIASNASTD